jgi:hypothetical protein
MNNCKKCEREFCCPEYHSLCGLFTGRECCYCAEERYQSMMEEREEEEFLNSPQGLDFVYGSKN